MGSAARLTNHYYWLAVFTWSRCRRAETRLRTADSSLRRESGTSSHQLLSRWAPGLEPDSKQYCIRLISNAFLAPGDVTIDFLMLSICINSPIVGEFEMIDEIMASSQYQPDPLIDHEILVHQACLRRCTPCLSMSSWCERTLYRPRPRAPRLHLLIFLRHA
nr:hypothetical protein CFP56_63803 [Quercus suber]